MRLWPSTVIGFFLLAAGKLVCVAEDVPTWTLTMAADYEPSIVTGRIVAEIPDSMVLLEEPNGRQHQIPVQKIQQRQDHGQPFVACTSEMLAADLLIRVPAGFEIVETEHYILCSNSATEYVEYCGRLLEVVFSRYFEFMAEQQITVSLPERKLAIIVFASEAEFQAFSAKQHPDISFADTPGYYSVRDNQTLLLDLTGDRSIRSKAGIRKLLSEKPLQVATVVHEAVHQLAFNSGLQIRMADNPLWISEGLAMYFEPTSSRSALLWNRPGQLNLRHHTAFVKLQNGQKISGGIDGLVASDAAFQNAAEMPNAYARAWAMTYYLFRQQKTGIQNYFRCLSKRKPMVGLTAEERILEFREAFGKSPDEMERELVSYIRRQRVSK